MALAALQNILRHFRGDKLDDSQSQDLVREALVMTLARATKSDTKVDSGEVSTVQRVIREATGHEMSEADIRVAASADLFESTSLENALVSLRGRLKKQDKILIMQSLAEVIRTDARVSAMELEYFDSVASALGTRPHEVAGLIASD